MVKTNEDQVAEAIQRDERRIMFQHLTRELSWVLTRKNENYGGKIFEQNPLVPDVPPSKLILARMSDKIQRLQALAGGETDKVGEAFEDTLIDLAGYIVLWQYNDLRTKYGQQAIENSIPSIAEMMFREALDNLIDVYFHQGKFTETERNDAKNQCGVIDV